MSDETNNGPNDSHAYGTPGYYDKLTQHDTVINRGLYEFDTAMEAQRRNRDRPLHKVILGLGHVSAHDVMLEDAHMDNAAIDVQRHQQNPHESH